MSAASAFAAQVERPPELRQPCARASSSVSRFCSAVIGGDHVGLEDLELGALHGVLGRLQLRLAVRAGGDLLAALLVDLLDEIAVLRLPVVRGLDLRLAVELDQQVAALDRACRA